VQDLDLDRSRDTAVWNYAAEHGYTIVSKDADFHPEHSLLLGPPPKVIWIRLGNCSMTGTATLPRERFIVTERLHARKEAAFLALS
jgi:predicted nuclease of predicted toxin-antitoxin system